MPIKPFLKSILNKRILGLFGLKIYSIRAFGRESCADIKRITPNPKVLLDVGANIGQTAELWHKEFPYAEIHSFEPVERLFNTLKKNCGDYARCNHLGVGDECTEITINYGKHDVSHSFVKAEPDKGGEVSSVVTLDHYAGENDINHIDLLKIDVEGYEPNVIAGAAGLLNAQKIDLVLVELGFDPDGYYVFYPEFADKMKAYGYKTLGVYDQTTAWNGDAEILFSNVLFARPGLKFID